MIQLIGFILKEKNNESANPEFWSWFSYGSIDI